MLDLLTSILTGGATGLLGTALSFATSYFQARQRHAQELELRRLDMELAEIESAGAGRVAALELEGEKAEAEARGLPGVLPRGRAALEPPRRRPGSCSSSISCGA